MSGYTPDQEPRRDPALAAALRAASFPGALSQEAAQALRQRIRRQAEAVRANTSGIVPSFAGVRPAAPWKRRSDVARRAAWLTPALLAAAVAGVLLLGRQQRQQTPPTNRAAAQAIGFASAEQALTAPVSDAEFARVVTREDDPAALLAIAVGAPAPSTRR